MQQFNLPEHPVITVIGKPGSGKSHLIKYLIHSMQAKRATRREFVYVFSKTKFNESYNYVPSQWVHFKFKPNILIGLMNVQREIREQGKLPPKILLVFDDCVQAGTFKSELFQDLIFNHRHYRISVIMAFQYMLNNTPTFLRENTDGAFIFRQTTDNSITGIRKAFGNSLSQEEFEQMHNDLEPHQFIFFNNVDSTSRVLKAPESIPNPKVKYTTSIDVSKLPDVE